MTIHTLNNQILLTPLKGQRHYVHSTSLFTAIGDLISKHLNGDAWISQLKINQMTDKQCVLSTESDPSATIGMCTLQYQHDTHTLYLLETENIVTERTHCDEKTLYQHAQLSNDKINHAYIAGANLIDQVVVLNRYLHDTQYPPEKQKWVFTALSLTQALKAYDDSNIQLKITHKLGSKMTRSALHIDGICVGRLDFALH